MSFTILNILCSSLFFFFSSRRRHTRSLCDWSSDVCSSDLVDTAELLFEDCLVPAANLVGGVEGHGFKHVMSGLETGRINIAARAVGVAQAAYDDTLAHLAGAPAEPPPALADMATRLDAARLLTYWAAAMKDRAERCDLEAGMAKLFASET